MSGVLSAALGGSPAERFECSRAGCRDRADFAIHWRNPRIHPETRRKTWLACAEHRDVLHDFLAARDFPVSVVPVSSLDADAEEAR